MRIPDEDAISTRLGAAGVWLRLARISNLPTVWSNALVGVAIGGAATVLDAALLPAAALSLIYIAGMMLNDAFDASHDEATRPSRAIPSGAVSRPTVFGVGFTLLAAGILLFTLAGARAHLLALVLGLAVVLYDWLHHRAAAAVTLMGVCRAFSYAAAAHAAGGGVDGPALAACGGAMIIYVTALTLLARREHRSDRHPARHLALLLPAPLLAVAFVVRPEAADAAVAAGILLGGWLLHAALMLERTPPRPVAAVTSWVAAISLADAYFLCLLDRPIAAAVAIGCFLITIIGQRFVPGS